MWKINKNGDGYRVGTGKRFFVKPQFYVMYQQDKSDVPRTQRIFDTEEEARRFIKEFVDEKNERFES